MAADKRHKPLTARGRFWQGHIQRWGQSGLLQVQYCRQQQLSVAAFRWWKRQLSDDRHRHAEPRIAQGKIVGTNGPFVELALSDSGQAGVSNGFPYEIALGPQRCLRLGRHYELERVRQLLALLESRC
jgi:hypothetical protein